MQQYEQSISVCNRELDQLEAALKVKGEQKSIQNKECVQACYMLIFHTEEQERKQRQMEKEADTKRKLGEK